MDNQLKHSELVKYRDLILATIDYWGKSGFANNPSHNFNWDEYFNNLREKTEESFTKGSLTRLKQWFRDLSEPYTEQLDFKFNDYLNEKTAYKVDVFSDYYARLDKIIAKGKITTDNQFYKLKNFVDYLIQTQPTDNERIEGLNKLLFEYEQRKTRLK